MRNRIRRKNELSRQLRIINEKTIIADFCTYRFKDHITRFVALTEFSMIFHANRLVLRARNAKQFLFAMRNDFANDDELVFRIKSKLIKIKKFSLTLSNF